MSDRECEHCGYDLAGLRGRGRCPECGEYYDLHDPARTASRTEQRYQRGARLLTLALALAAVGVVVAGGLLSLVVKQPMRPIALSLLFGGVLGLAALTRYLYEDRR